MKDHASQSDKEISRRRLLRRFGIGAAAVGSVGTVFGRGAARAIGTSAFNEADDAGAVATVEGAASNGRAHVRIAGKRDSVEAHIAVAHRDLRDGDRVIVTEDAVGGLTATPLFLSLDGPIEALGKDALTVQGVRCIIDKSTMVYLHNTRASVEKGPVEIVAYSDHAGFGVDSRVGVLSVQNAGDGSNTAHALYPLEA